MLSRLGEKAREWSIAIVGVCVVAGGLVFASSQSPSPSSAPPVAQPAPAQTKAPAAPAQNPPQRQVQAPQQAPQPAPTPPPTPAPPASGQNAPAPAPHDHGAGPAQHNMGQSTPAAGAPARTAAAAEPSAGRQVYRKCQACHSLEPGKNALGPTLANVIGRKAGDVAAFNYSPAMKSSNVVWDAKSLDAYLADPQKFIPGNKMPFPGLKNENERRDVIAYLGAAPDAGAAPQPAPTARAAPPPRTPPPRDPKESSSSASYIPDVRYTLRSGIAEGRMVYLGVGGAIDGQVNPVLSAAEGQVVQIILLNGEGAEHDIAIPDQDARSPRITGRGASTTLVFRAQKSGDYVYFCSVPGHRQAGMEGKFLVTPRPPAQTVVEADISHLATDVPPPVGNRPPQTVRVDLVAVELEGRLAEGTTFGYWTFNGRVPGPMLRVRVGDTVDVHVKNSGDSAMIHSVDFHAATGPGGGAAATQVDPGQEKSFKFKALTPGLYVYHCATPMVAHHIANGMYGLILVEPEGGLPPVDREFYVMQGEVYTEAPFGQRGSQEFSVEKLLNERPEYFVFNGSVGALSKLHPLEAKVGETVRIYFGVGGPNYISSFHVIGEIFDKAYQLGSVTSPPITDVQSIAVP
ncbi:MAG: multicopper oxidase domain-containing protein, partial [Variibacter sp.]|nr:multicopper oxidase domain-containing protein [Variibacter sp.]